MSNGVLRLPGSNEKVDVVYKAPRMICASEHTIKLYTAEVISANSKRFSFFGSLGIFLSVLPVASTSQQFNEFLGVSANLWPGIFFVATGISLLACIIFAWQWLQLKSKADPDYLIEKLVENDDQQLQPSTETTEFAKTLHLSDLEQKLTEANKVSRNTQKKRQTLNKKPRSYFFYR